MTLTEERLRDWMLMIQRLAAGIPFDGRRIDPDGRELAAGLLRAADSFPDPEVQAWATELITATWRRGVLEPEAAAFGRSWDAAAAEEVYWAALKRIQGGEPA